MRKIYLRFMAILSLSSAHAQTNSVLTTDILFGMQKRMASILPVMHQSSLKIMVSDTILL